VKDVRVPLPVAGNVLRSTSESNVPHLFSSEMHERLVAQIGRTQRSVEFKHEDISAVLEEFGMPWIPGYKPKRNYQNAIFDATDRNFSAHPGLLYRPLLEATVVPFVEPLSFPTIRSA
jgi:hypothetical protein